MSSDDVCLIVALDLKMLWFDLLLCTNHTHVHRDYLHNGKSLKHNCRCAAASGVLLLSNDFVTSC